MDDKLFYKAEISIRTTPGVKPRYHVELLISVESVRITKEIGSQNYSKKEAESTGASIASKACYEFVTQRAKFTQGGSQYSRQPSLVHISPDVLKQYDVLSEVDGVAIRQLSEKNTNQPMA